MIWQIAIAGNAKRCAPDGARARRERRALSLQALVSLSFSLLVFSTRLGSCDRKHTLDGIEIPREEDGDGGGFCRRGSKTSWNLLSEVGRAVIGEQHLSVWVSEYP